MAQHDTGWSKRIADVPNGLLAKFYCRTRELRENFEFVGFRPKRLYKWDKMAFGWGFEIAKFESVVTIELGTFLGALNPILI